MRENDIVMKERFKNHKNVCLELESLGYKKTEVTISIFKANVMAFLTAGPFALIFALIYFSLKHYGLYELNNYIFRNPSMFFILALFIVVCIPVHEGLHGIFWAVSCKKKFKSIQFGVIWKNLTPYCHCKEALSVLQYYSGLLAPFIILGIIPSIIAVIIGNQLLLAVGIINILSAGGDTTIACLLVKYIGKNVRVSDHPIKCGCVAFEK